MREMISAHPRLAWVLIAWAAFLVVCMFLGWLRYRARTAEPLPDRDRPPYDKPILTLHVEDRITPELRRFHSGGVIDMAKHSSVPLILPQGEHRLPMRSRFLKPDDQSAVMADQILADQAVADETAGEEVTDPQVEPDATTFYHLREVIGQFTYVLGKEGFVGIVEAMRSGEDTPMVEVPAEWAEPITVAVFEVARLRHG